MHPGSEGEIVENLCLQDGLRSQLQNISIQVLRSLMISLQEMNVSEHEADLFVVDRQVLIDIFEHPVAISFSLVNVSVRVEQKQILLRIKDVHRVFGHSGDHLSRYLEILFSLCILPVQEAHVCETFEDIHVAETSLLLSLLQNRECLFKVAFTLSVFLLVQQSDTLLELSQPKD